MSNTPPPLNQILYGPPGTGKTHNTIDEALAILDPAYLDEHRIDRTKLRARFNELEASKHVRFVTFHQSFSYEDFVEGLRAEPDEVTGQLKFLPMDGVFKTICEDAITKVVVDEVPDIDLSENTIWKMSLGNRNEENYVYEECIANSRILLGWGAGINFSDVKNKADIVTAFKTKHLDYTTSDYPVTAVNSFVLGMKVGDLVVVADGNSKFRAIGEITGNYEHLPRAEEDDDFAQSRAVRWLKVFSPSTACSVLMNKNFMMKAIYRLGPEVIDRSKLRQLLSSKVSEVRERDGPTARVLIIDEINRGNISRIFGELITLIEPTKRAGNEEALSVMLPYSKQLFSIPNNLFLIGTMNTSDRSLTGLDIALRRRFVFKEMPPRPQLLTGVNVNGIAIDVLLEIMNQRIEALLDREHCLGHAYFMPLIKDSSIARLARIFKQQIIPLLKEYFFEDWERIGWVLNDHRKLAVNCFVLPASANATVLFGEDFGGKVQGKTWEINTDAYDRIDAYLGIIDHKTTTPVVASLVEREVAEYGGYRLERLADTTVKVFENGEEQVAMPILRTLAKQLGVNLQNPKGGDHNTRQLGDKVIKAALQAKS
ncbi:AAA family ATPase [Undibacterium sp.]|uniref:AAA family ATPase n=1 Tax=Undibacterium sp. TaxID=1914977 RepID=UPI00374D6E61